jgi:hypothetical protein
MINWDNYKIGQELNLKIAATNSVADLKVKISDFEWAPNRTLHLTDVEVIESNVGDYKKGDLLRLPLVVKDESFKFLVVTHNIYYKEIVKEGLMSLN